MRPDLIIKRECALHFGISRSDMDGPARDRRTAHPRQLAMALCRHYSRYSLPQIGRFFRRDHTTVLHAISQVKARMDQGGDYGVTVAKICALVEIELTARRIAQVNARWQPEPGTPLLLPSPARATIPRRVHLPLPDCHARTIMVAA